MKRWMVILVIVVVVLTGSGLVLLERALRPCELLDIRSGRSGCVRVIALPEGFRARHLHVANVGDQMVVEGDLNDSVQVLILNTQTWEVIDQVPRAEVEVADVPEAAQMPVHYEWGTTRLMRGVWPRVGFLAARMPDDSVYALVDEITSQVTFLDAVTDEPITTITLPASKGRGVIALSHDGRRFLIRLADGRLTAWDVASGALLYSVTFPAILDWDWLTDNQTIVTTLWDGEQNSLALFRVPQQAL